MIKQQNPISHKDKLKNWLQLFIFFSIFIVWYKGIDNVIFTLMHLVFVFVILILLTEFLDREFDGWEISDVSISLTRINLLGIVESKTLNFNEIDYVVYVRPGAKRKLTFQINSNKNSYLLTPPMDIYTFGKTLKFLKNQGIRIDFFEKDHEIELYLNDVINSIPITNDTKLNS